MLSRTPSRLLFLTLALALLASAAFGQSLNEIRIDEPGTDVNEYLEIFGTPNQDLQDPALDLFLVVIGDGPGDSGTVEDFIDLNGMIDANGFFLLAEPGYTLGGTVEDSSTLNFENGDNLTFLLVQDFTGAINDDLDADDNCVLDTMPWAAIIDGVALIEEPNQGPTTPPTGTECEYATSLGQPTVGPDGPNVPGHVGRDPDGTGMWVIGAFDPADGTDTPDASNTGQIPVELMTFSVD